MKKEMFQVGGKVLGVFKSEVGAPNNCWLNPINKKLHASNGLPLYDMMYERRCRTPIVEKKYVNEDEQYDISTEDD
ncbi:hypothetical protein OSB04_023120 [Centaurea solstitialis]|uniref:Uncharacterized protein n=1 Tax=Centaurea solstitialis TaxID=347529 RepID=A0AA38T390_9ASTR|nr:hypothetical protein OSB04_023120 [Centaurea solstitialis]